MEVHLREELVHELPLGRHRPDLERGFPGDPRAPYAGFHGELRVFGDNPITLAVNVRLEDATSLSLGRIVLLPGGDTDQSFAAANLVSVVITVALLHVSIEPTIESVLAQTYPNFEVVVVNSAGIAEMAEALDTWPGIRVVESRPGSAAARNAGLAVSRGSVITFLNAAERLLPGALETGLRELAANPQSVHLLPGRCTVSRPDHAEPEYPQQPLISADHYHVMLRGDYILTPSVVLFRRAALRFRRFRFRGALR